MYFMNICAWDPKDKKMVNKKRKKYANVASVAVLAAVFCVSGWAVAGPESRKTAVPKTGQTMSYDTGDDGDLQKGTAWPSPRFTDHGDTVTDNLTGLMWVKAPHSLKGNTGGQTYHGAIAFCTGLNYAGYSDWRLPNVRELHSLIDYGCYYPALPSGHPFPGVRSSNYWSSTTHVGYADRAWFVFLYHGNVSLNVKATSYDVWPVRSGE
jgi:hypothetical protein